MIRWLRKKSNNEEGQSEESKTLNHCPFCGSRGIVGGSDGSVSCSYCSMVFSVTIQPSHTSMPMTVDGEPYELGGDVEETASPRETVEGPVAGPEGGIERYRVEASAMYATATGERLTRREYINHLAIRHSGSARREVLTQVRGSRDA